MYHCIALRTLTMRGGSGFLKGRADAEGLVFVKFYASVNSCIIRLNFIRPVGFVLFSSFSHTASELI